MNRVFFLFIVTIFVSNLLFSQPLVYEDPYKNCHGESINREKCYNEVEHYLISSQYKVFRADSLNLNVNGVTFLNSGEEASSVSYLYAGYAEQIKSHVVWVRYYEGQGFYLIDDSLKTIIGSVLGLPVVVSPNKKYFVTFESDLEAGYQTSGIDLWSSETGRFRKMWQLTNERIWGIKNARWTNNSSLQLEYEYSDGTLWETKTKMVHSHSILIIKIPTGNFLLVLIVLKNRVSCSVLS